MGKKQVLTATLDIALVGLGVMIVGVPLHYLYDATGKFWASGLIGPVNESAWEHFKLFYWPMVILGFFEYPFMRRRFASYFMPKFVSMLTAFVAMTFFYYIPRALFGSSLLISIGSFALSAVAAQIVFFLMARRTGIKKSETTGILLIIILGVMFISFTFAPPHLIPWLDMKGGFYGIN